VVEIDIAHDSRSKLSNYAEMGVPEVWRYDEHQFFIYRLERSLYVEMPASLSFPLLTTQFLAQLLEQSKTAGQTVTLRSLREWIHDHKV
jgi:Uma2 family endonuclease